MFGVVGSTGPDANDARLEINVGVAMMCLSGFAVGLRLASRRIARQPLLWDDWTIIAAAFFAWADCIGQIYGQHLLLQDIRSKLKLGSCG